jgi:type IV pilus biogenesis protein CpaD/CtpE
MRLFARIFFLLVTTVVAASALAGLTGCSDDLISSRDDEHTGAVPPAPWENNPMNMPDTQPGRKY